MRKSHNLSDPGLHHTDCSAEGGSRLDCVREKESLPHLSDSFARMRLRSVCVKRNKLRDLRAALEVERARGRSGSLCDPLT